ncbi:E3 ubiquitin-protein ligase NHLRC1-like [Leucoraja erinacea]|uniref:E3 ubiquitin-protein ligase NHLRC1-like n=1 Tax=Leucoraja erinaceus TaxID=7782 RepID=UPI0024578710|nr:E3 ubiquitin-protein ligase NHLRC1-like [Leucoraja erinacea]
MSLHAARSLLRDIQLNVLECKVCFEIYSDSAERRPCVLPCGHAVCRQCAGALSQGGRQLQCPFCRRCGPPSQAIDCLPLLQLAELLNPVPEGGGGSSNSGSGPCPLTQPRLTAVLGGWGKLLNPRALSVCPSSGALAVADDDPRRPLRLWERGEDSLKPAAAAAGFSGLLYPLGVALAGGGLLLVVADGGDSSLKVFALGESQKPSAKTIQGDFALPWGVAAGPGSDQVALTDAQRGTLLLLSLHLPGGGLLSTETVSEGLQCPREVAVCPLHCCIHVVEHLQPLPPSTASTSSCIRLKTFNSRRQLIHQLDSNVFSPARLPAGLSAIAADGRGNVLVADGLGGTVGLVEGITGTLRYRVLIAEGLVRPAGLACTADGELVVLDSGDHTCKIYTAPEVP